MNVPASPAPTDPVVAVRETRTDAEAAVKALGSAGLDLATVSLVGKAFHEDGHAHGFYTVGDRLRAWGASGGLWGAAWALLLGSAVFVMPPLGVVAAAGPITLALVAAVESAVAVGGVSALCVALGRLGVPHERAAAYEADVAADRFLVLVHGAQEDRDRARLILAAGEVRHALPIHQAA